MYVIGVVLRPQGLKGEIKIESISTYPERFKKLKKIFIKKDDFQAYSIENVRIADKFVYLKLNDIDNRDQAENFRGCEVFIEESELLKLSEHEYFYHDLIGCRVFTEEKKYIGKLVQISQYGSNDVYTVKDEAGKEVLIPAIREVIKHVDIIKKEIHIQVLEGLID